ncbi:hypothetical protein, partial [Klebsiella pneumoniae]|uniref:hypothetical protein n=1 Tax=Klebsiella pneumoniae TaxID=573 RepID=UPI0025A2FF72
RQGDPPLGQAVDPAVHQTDPVLHQAQATLGRAGEAQLQAVRGTAVGRAGLWPGQWQELWHHQPHGI